ncbi:MAG: hypothetical protein GX591_00525 [Planctomycetes bacterium]|nr:hypothetical protein [Planctomycetota bacterium]
MAIETKQQQAVKAALAGLDWMVRNQCMGDLDGNHGRLPELYDCRTHRVMQWTTNWTSGVGVEALLAGYLYSGNRLYLESAAMTVEFIKTLQIVSDRVPRRIYGAIRECIPQTDYAHPRDALTAAWALLDYGRCAGDEDAVERAGLFADWFSTVAMEQGYPYWTARFDDKPWDPSYCGSFHSGSAFFFHRMWQVTGEDRYLDAMATILDFYNAHHLDEDGCVTVILDRQTFEKLDARDNPNDPWKIMHRYNDDFGTLANLAAWKDLGDQKYLDAARRFCEHMIRCQRDDGGFGPAEFSVPSAGPSVLIELAAARSLGCDWAAQQAMDRAADYVLSRQWLSPGRGADGAFLGYHYQGDYTQRGTIAVMRTAAYAVLSLLRYAGANDACYFFGPEGKADAAERTKA